MAIMIPTSATLEKNTYNLAVFFILCITSSFLTYRFAFEHFQCCIHKITFGQLSIRGQFIYNQGNQVGQPSGGLFHQGYRLCQQWL